MPGHTLSAPPPPPPQLRMHQTQVYELTRRLHVQESASAAFASSLAGAGGAGAAQRGGHSQQHRGGDAGALSHADATSRELMQALGVPMGSPGHASAALSASRAGAGSDVYGLRSAARRGASGVGGGVSGVGPAASIFDGPDSAIELAGARAAAQRLQGELASAQQREQVGRGGAVMAIGLALP